MNDFILNFGKSELLILLAMLPTFVIGFIIYKKDIIEKEPFLLLLKLFLFGVLSTGVALFLEIYMQKIFAFSQETNFLSILFRSFIIIALCEELIKWLFTYVITWRGKNFNYTYDAIVYSVFIALGFATMENIMVILFNNVSILTSLLRGLITVPAHAFFAILSGYYLGLAKSYFARGWNRKAKKNICLSIILPILMHGLFDFLLFTDNTVSIVLVTIFIIYLYFSSYVKVSEASRKSKKITEK